MEIKSIKFYCTIPKAPTASGQRSTELKGAYFAVGEFAGDTAITRLDLEITPGPESLVKIQHTNTDLSAKLYIYQLADIVGRIEVTPKD